MKQIELGTILHMEKGKKPKLQSKDAIKGYLPYVDIKAFEQGIIDNYASIEKVLLCEDGDLLIVGDGSRSGLTGRAIKGIVGSTLYKIYADGMTTDYLRYFIESKYLLLNTQKKGTGTPHLNANILKKSKLIVPSIEEQERIVAKIEELFSDLDNAVETLNATKAKLEVYRQAVLLKAFEPKNNWNIGKLGDVIQVLTDYHANGSYEILKQHVELLDTPDYAVMIRSTNFEQNDFSNDLKYITKEAYDFLKKSQLFGDEVLMGKIGNAGKVYYMKDLNRPMSLAMNLFAMRFDHCVSSKYVYYFLNSAKSIEDIKKHIKGVGTPTINKNSVRDLYFAYPDTNEQKNIVTEVETKLSLYDSVNLTLDNILRQASAMRQSILKQAFEGRLL